MTEFDLGNLTRNHSRKKSLGIKIIISCTQTILDLQKIQAPHENGTIQFEKFCENIQVLYSGMELYFCLYYEQAVVQFEHTQIIF